MTTGNASFEFHGDADGVHMGVVRGLDTIFETTLGKDAAMSIAVSIVREVDNHVRMAEERAYQEDITRLINELYKQSLANTNVSHEIIIKLWEFNNKHNAAIAARENGKHD